MICNSYFQEMISTFKQDFKNDEQYNEVLKSEVSSPQFGFTTLFYYKYNYFIILQLLLFYYIEYNYYYFLFIIIIITLCSIFNSD